MSPSEKLVALITPRKPSACTCETCRQMCKRAPCLGTPQDIERLICLGLGGSMARTLWAAVDGAPLIEMVQLRGLDMQPDGATTCCMFNRATERCMIHAQKPTEGSLSFHEPTSMLDSPTLAVALTWMLPENQMTVTRLLLLYP